MKTGSSILMVTVEPPISSRSLLASLSAKGLNSIGVAYAGVKTSFGKLMADGATHGSMGHPVDVFPAR